MASINKIPSSFKDPAGSLYDFDGRIIRCIWKSAQDEWLSFIESGLFDILQEKNYLQYTGRISPEEASHIFKNDNKEIIDVVEHKKFLFASYPYEWSFGMLKDAAKLHLELLDICLQKNFTLKDGTSYNIQFIGFQPIFTDILSIVPYKVGNPWLGFTQFCQLFLFPLMIMAYKGIPFQPLLRSELGGIDVLSVRKYFSLIDVFRPGVFLYIFLQAKLQKSFSSYNESLKNKIVSTNITRNYVQKNTLCLKKTIEAFITPKESSFWDRYAENNSYNSEDFQLKYNFVLKVLNLVCPSLLFDFGCNTGEYSILASRYAKYVVAIDSDHKCIDRFYSHLKNSKIKNILPLVVNILNPSPNIGWKLTEYPSFFQRESPDMILCLALLHHLVIGNNIPLEEFIKWIIYTAPSVILEFVTKDDPMVKILLKDKEDVYPAYNVESFEVLLKKYCAVKEKLILNSNTRILYWLQRNKYAQIIDEAI